MAHSGGRNNYRHYNRSTMGVVVVSMVAMVVLVGCASQVSAECATAPLTAGTCVDYPASGVCAPYLPAGSKVIFESSSKPN